jgi:hypothetical protein
MENTFNVRKTLLENIQKALLKAFHEKNQIESCVVCKHPTHYRVNDHVEKRNYYVEGAGQCCFKCFKEQQ